MNNEEMFKSINKGIPNYIDVEISIPILVNECSSDKEALLIELRELRTKFEEGIINRFGGIKSNHQFFDGLMVSTDYKNSETQLFISPKPFLRRLKQLLGISNPSLDFNDEELRQELLSRVEVLKSIVTPLELKSEFPLIYRDYENSILSMQKKDRLIKEYRETEPSKRDPNFWKRIKDGQKAYDLYGYNTDFDIFLQNQIQLYRNFVVRRQFVEDVYRHPLNLSRFQGLDKAKFELYLADRYLQIAENTTDIETIQGCIYYIATYLRETEFTKEQIHNNEKKIITFENILKRYKAILRKYKSKVKPLDEPREHFKNYHIKHVENHIKKYYSFQSNWVYVPRGEDDDKKELAREGIYDHPSTTTDKKKTKEEIIKRRFKLLREKKQFYFKEKPEFIFYGLNTFDGYIAHIYENGYVVLDKFYNDFANYMPASEEAIYVIRTIDFERLSKLDKPSLMKQDGVKRIYHVGSWQDRVQKYIDIPSTEETKEQARKLVLSYQKK